MKPFRSIKVSTKPLLEWHAFATIPDEGGNGKINGFSVVVSNAGDWTKEIIMSPPTKLWVRGDPLYNLLYTSNLFKRIVVVATGSGIGPCLSLLYANVTPCRVLWSTSQPGTTYGPKIMNSVLKADSEAIVWNTRTLGRPDMVLLTYQLVLESSAEAVFIISNPKVTRKVVYSMETRGIPAYGAIFDS
jgi:NAD(P)H-flavin reductase